jgi:thioesterase domain-containing protein
LADGIVLERAGIPAVSLCTDAFRITAEAMANQMGFPGYQYVAVPHPIASRTEKEIDDMARDALPDILRVLGAGLTYLGVTPA